MDLLGREVAGVGYGLGHGVVLRELLGGTNEDGEERAGTQRDFRIRPVRPDGRGRPIRPARGTLGGPVSGPAIAGAWGWIQSCRGRRPRIPTPGAQVRKCTLSYVSLAPSGTG